MLDIHFQEGYEAAEEVNAPSVPIDENQLLARYQHLVKGS